MFFFFKEAFQPTQVPDLQLWLDASDTSTIVESGDNVSQWNDKSGNGNHVTQGTGARQPTTNTVTINGKNALDFNSDYLQNDDFASLAESPHSIFFVVNPTASAGNKTIITWQKFGDGVNTDRIIISSDPSETLSYNDGLNVNILDSTVFTTPVLVSNTHSSTTVTTRINGAAANLLPTITDALPTGCEFFTIGQEFDGASPGTPSDYFLGSMAEFIVYSRVLSAAEIITVERYLAAKWGITLS